MTTLEELGVSEFAEALDAVRWTDLLQDSNYTVFAPSNKAMQEYLPQKVLHCYQVLIFCSSKSKVLTH